MWQVILARVRVRRRGTGKEEKLVEYYGAGYHYNNRSSVPLGTLGGIIWNTPQDCSSKGWKSGRTPVFYKLGVAAGADNSPMPNPQPVCKLTELQRLWGNP